MFATSIFLLVRSGYCLTSIESDRRESSLLYDALKVVKFQAVSSIKDFTLIILYHGGFLAALQSCDGKLKFRSWFGNDSSQSYDDLVFWKGKILAISRGGVVCYIY